MIEISIAQLNDNRAVLTMLNQVTLDLIEKGIRQWRYPWSALTIKQQVSLQKRYLLKESAQLIGSFNLGSAIQVDEISLPERSLVLAEIVLDPLQQGIGYSQEVFKYCIQQADEHGLDLYLASPTENTKLTKLFKQYHFDFYKQAEKTCLYRYHPQ